MKHTLWLGAFLTVAGIVAATQAQVPNSPAPIPGQPGQIGPGDQGATLRLPGAETAPPAPSNLEKTAPFALPSSALYPTTPGGVKIALPPSRAFDMNKDIEITPAAGPWVIFIMPYSGPEAPAQARKFVNELRTTYKLHGFVFNHGQEEKRKEFERVQKLRQEQIDALAKAGLKGDVPFRAPAIRIDEHTCVLVGGYQKEEEATAALERTIRKLPMPDPKKVALVSKFEGRAEVDPKSGEVILRDAKSQFVNPFLKAFVSRNPASGHEESGSTLEKDLKYLRKINEGEPFTLLNCRKPYTLAIKQFNMQYKTLGDAKEATGFIKMFDSLGLTKKTGEWQDMTANNAHNLADALRKSGLPETYVLHCKHCSYVTVGGFDRLENDPQLTATQNWLENAFKAPAYGPLDLFSRPVPMPVPGVSPLLTAGR